MGGERNHVVETARCGDAAELLRQSFVTPRPTRPIYANHAFPELANVLSSVVVQSGGTMSRNLNWKFDAALAAGVALTTLCSPASAGSHSPKKAPPPEQ